MQEYRRRIIDEWWFGWARRIANAGREVYFRARSLQPHFLIF